MSIIVYQIHKRSSYVYSNIQDKYAISPDHTVFALADGTTQSFNSDVWAQMLASQFVNAPCFHEPNLLKIFTQAAESFKQRAVKFSDNPAKASLEKVKQQKGGTSTILALKIEDGGKLNIAGCGDTNLFVLNKGNVIKSFPFDSVDQLDSNNSFLNSEKLLAEDSSDIIFSIAQIAHQKDDIIIIATDALSRLFLKRSDLITDFIEIKNFTELNDFCVKHWEGKILEEDDISAIVYNSTTTQKLITIVPPGDFSFPKEPEYEFIPSPVQKKENKLSNNTNALTDKDMKQILDQFSGVANDFRRVLRNQKAILIGLTITIALLLLNISLGIYQSFVLNTQAQERQKASTETHASSLPPVQATVPPKTDGTSNTPPNTPASETKVPDNKTKTGGKKGEDKKKETGNAQSKSNSENKEPDSPKLK